MSSRPPGSTINLVLSVVMVLLGVSLCWGAVRNYRHPFAELEGATLIPITGRLSEDPYIHSTRSMQVKLRLHEHPGVTFLIYNFYSSADIHGIATKLKAGDTVTMDIVEEDADKYIHHTRPLSYWEKHFDPPLITIYSLSDSKDNWYLDIRPLDPASEKGNLISLIVVLSLFTSITIWGVFSIRRYARMKK